MYNGDYDYSLKLIEYTAGYIHARVVKVRDEVQDEEFVGMYIPKIMPLFDMSEGSQDTTESLDTSIFANDSSCAPEAESNVKLANYILVKPIGMSNMIPPALGLGEKIHVVFIDGDFKKSRYLLSDCDEIKRSTDKIVFFVYGKEDADNTPEDKYFVELNSIDGKLHIHTSMVNTEVNSYDIILDGNNGEFTVKDDQENKFGIVSADKLVYLRNQSDSEIKLLDRDIHITCPNDVNVTCANFNLDASTNVIQKGGAKVDISSPTITLDGTGMIKLKTPMVDGEVSGMFKINCPMNIFGGALAAVSVGISPSPMSPPGVANANGTTNTLIQTPTGVAAYGDKTVAAIAAILPFLVLPVPGLGAAVVSPLLPFIPSPMVQL